MNFNAHVLFNEQGGAVQECYLEGESIRQIEAQFVERYPLAVYWEIGVPECAAIDAMRGLREPKSESQ